MKTYIYCPHDHCLGKQQIELISGTSKIACRSGTDRGQNHLNVFYTDELVLNLGFTFKHNTFEFTQLYDNLKIIYMGCWYYLYRDAHENYYNEVRSIESEYPLDIFLVEK